MKINRLSFIILEQKFAVHGTYRNTTLDHAIEFLNLKGIKL